MACCVILKMLIDSIEARYFLNYLIMESGVVLIIDIEEIVLLYL